VHPFDLKSALLARHAQHVVLIHFPIALLIVGVAFDFLALARPFAKHRQTLTMAAYYNLIVAALSAVAAVVTGVLAWQLQLDGESLKGTLKLHLVLGIVSSLLIWLVWWLHFRAYRNPERGLPAYRLPIEVLAVSVIAVTGHLGGFLSGVNGAG
jgi:uncharacterized membrane protein